MKFAVFALLFLMTTATTAATTIGTSSTPALSRRMDSHSLTKNVSRPASFRRIADGESTSPCFDLGKAQRYMALFRLSSREFDSTQLCKPASRERMLVEALESLERARFVEKENERTHPLDLNIVTEPYFEYLRRRIDKIEFGGCSEDAAVVACVKANETILHLQEPFFDQKLSPLFRMATLLHEAKHAEGFPHIDCLKGPLAGTSAGCDSSLRYRGAYGVELEFYVRVARRGIGFSPAIRALARASAIALMEENFNEPPARPVEALALTSKHDGHLAIFNGETIHDFLNVKAGRSKLIARNSGVAVLPEAREIDAWIFDPYSGEKMNRTYLDSLLGGTLRSYNSLESEKRPTIRDIVNRPDLQGRLYPDRVEFSLQPLQRGDDVLVKSVSTSGLEISGFASSEFCWRPHPVLGSPSTPPVQLLSTRGELLQIIDLYADSAFIKRMDCELPSETQSIVSFRGLYLALTSKGRIVALTRDGTLTEIPAALKTFTASDLTPFSFYLDL